MGVAIGDLAPDEAKRLGLDSVQGAAVAEVIPGGPADQAGIQAGDVVVEFNGEKVKNSHAFPSMVARLQPGAVVPVVFLHEGKKFERNVTLGSLDQPQGGTGKVDRTSREELGISIRDLTATEKRRVQGGIIVQKVENGSLAQSVGIQEGDLLLELNGRPILDLEDFKRRLGQIQQEEVIRLGLARGPNIYYFAFRKE